MSYAAEQRKTAHISSASAAQIEAEDSSAYLAGIVSAPHGRIAAVACTPLLIPVFTALQLIQKIGVIIIVRLK